MLKKICMLFMMLTVSNMAEAQMFAPNQGSANQKATAQKAKSVAATNGASADTTSGDKIAHGGKRRT